LAAASSPEAFFNFLNAQVNVVYIYTILIAVILGFGFVLTDPISIHYVLNFDPQLKVTMGVRFLLFKHYFAKRRKIYKLKIKYTNDQFEKGWIVQMKSPSAKSFFHWLPIIVSERHTFSRTLAAFANLAKRIIFSADRHYLKINLRGGLSSPDLTGQFFLSSSCPNRVG
jgi:hypothetical protein